MTATVETPHAHVIPAGHGVTKWFINSPVEIKISSEQTGGAYSLTEHVAEIDAGAPLHIHHEEDEAFYILEGYVAIQFAEQHYIAGPGSYAFLPRGVPHRWSNAGDAPARMLIITSPGTFAEFVTEVDQAAQETGTTGTVAPQVMEQIPAIAARHGIEFVRK